MKQKKGLWTIIVVFYVGMIILTICSRTIHNASLPKVKIARLHKETFSYKDAETKQGVIPSKREITAYAIPKELFDSGQIFVVVKEVINEEERNIARKVEDIEVGLTNEDSYEIIDGFITLNQLIVVGYECLEDGDEVYVE